MARRTQTDHTKEQLSCVPITTHPNSSSTITHWTPTFHFILMCSRRWSSIRARAKSGPFCILLKSFSKRHSLLVSDGNRSADSPFTYTNLVCQLTVPNVGVRAAPIVCSLKTAPFSDRRLPV